MRRFGSEIEDGCFWRCEEAQDAPFRSGITRAAYILLPSYGFLALRPRHGAQIAHYPLRVLVYISNFIYLRIYFR